MKNASWYSTNDDFDVIGFDTCPKGRKTFASVYEEFCSGWDGPYAIGKTGNGGSSADKTYWLERLTVTDVKTACPNYVR